MIVVFGANGFLGNNILKKLDENNIEYIALTKQNGGDLNNYEEINATFREFENVSTIINCAAFVGGISYGKMYQVKLLDYNVQMSLNIYRLANEYRVKQIINPISNCSYPGNKSIYSEKEFWDGDVHESVNSYGSSRRLLLKLSQTYKQQFNLNSVNLIFPNMYGPMDHFDTNRSHALGSLIRRFYEAKKSNANTVTLWGTGRPEREWMYVEDACEIIVKYFIGDEHIDLLNIGVGKTISIDELAKLIASQYSYNGKIEYDGGVDGAPHKEMNAEMFNKKYGKYSFTKLREGIRKTINWYEKYRMDE
jgi:GDP-L-fucose synthase